MIDQVTEIQICYPQIYMACHTEHVKAKSNEVQLSSRDSAILAHLTVEGFTSPGKLAKHLQVSASTLSEAVQNLVSLGYVKTRTNVEDERRSELALTDKGLNAMKLSSVLDSEKIAAVLERLTPQERAKAVEGLRVFARACAEIEQS